MRIAHLSDLHLLTLEGLTARRLLSKRLTGYLNLRFKRGHKHSHKAAEKLAAGIVDAKPDHVVITGDLTNLALESEFALAKSFLSETLGLPPEQVSVVPGNHDVYTRGAFLAERFKGALGPYMQSDLPGLAGPRGFPFVRLRGHTAIVGLSSAVPQLPLVAAGHLGAPQLEQLTAILRHPEVSSRAVVALVHHPPTPAKPGILYRYLEGLVDGHHLVASLSEHPLPVLVLHGHLHRRVHHQPAPNVLVAGATSASLMHEEPLRNSAFNVYTVLPSGAVEVRAHVATPEGFSEHAMLPGNASL